MTIRIFFWATLTFAPIASAMAFLIVYGEYRQHFKDRSMPLKIAIRTACWTFILFVALLFITALIFQSIS